MDNNWRTALTHDSRQKIVNRIMDTLQRRMSVQGQDGVNELWKIARRFEEKIYYAATDQHDYLRRISLKMLNLELKAPNPPNNALSSSANANQSSGNKPLDASNNWRTALTHDSRQKIVNRIMDTLQRRMLVEGQDDVNELWKIARRFEENVYYAATDQHDYLRRISLRMLNLELKAPNPPNNALSSSASANQSSGNKPLDATTMMQHPMRSQTQGQVQSWPQVPQSVESGILAGGMQSSASLASNLSSINSVPQQTSVLHVSGQGSTNLPTLISAPGRQTAERVAEFTRQHQQTRTSTQLTPEDFVATSRDFRPAQIDTAYYGPTSRGA